MNPDVIWLMKTTFVISLVSLIAVLGYGKRVPQESSRPTESVATTITSDRSSPSATFAVYQHGIEKNEFLQAVQSSSHQQKRFMLFETLFAGGMAADPQKKAFVNLLLKNGVELDKLRSDAGDADELIALVERKIDKLDQFLADALTLLSSDDKQHILPDIKNVEIDGERATLTFKMNIYSYHSDAGDSTIKEVVSVYEQNMFMRKYGPDWLICPEQEWLDASFKWTALN